VNESGNKVNEITEIPVNNFTKVIGPANQKCGCLYLITTSKESLKLIKRYQCFLFQTTTKKKTNIHNHTPILFRF